ncbi:GGDEF domain-containing protein [Photobacterium sp. TY1-4]|uniref:GGDEF domain-containing protein n=1 Tax=Photobacterium sp. TY1-4 TaxID=2899122 RepID=UPI0021C0A131|nr:GGDEF domain-containing protein [Photobacterium sp. TY1-4]UXI02456.1 GGDEF domain-containing protein [Photobacterium sp. TY1-4]
MVFVAQVKTQFAILLSAISAFCIAYTFHASELPVDYANVVIEGVMALSCLLLMFGIHGVKENRPIYRLLLLSSSLLFIGHFIDVVDEFIRSCHTLDILEDLCQSFGFLLLLLTSARWVKFHRQQNRKMKYLAETDSLTGLLNRRAFTQSAQTMLDNAEGQETPFSLILLDIDHFKLVNDNYGHLTGDHVLYSVGQTIQASLRQEDLLSRFGGEEFVILLNHTTLADAKQITERIRSAIEALRIDHKHTQLQCTASFGVACLPSSEANITALIKNADQALYQAKALGRNRWCVA